MNAVHRTPFPAQQPGQATSKPYHSKPNPEALAQQKKAEQPVRPTTNTRGETLGQHINTTA